MKRMRDLLVVLISGEDAKANLARSLAAGPPHPWAFNDWKKQMQAVAADRAIVYLELIDERGNQVNRFTGSSAVLRTKRAVLGTIRDTIEYVTAPFHAGYSYQFTFDVETDQLFEPPVPLEELSGWLTERNGDLTVEPVQLRELVQHAKSNKVGVYIDGAPRLAAYFNGSASPPAGPVPVPRATSASAPPSESTPQLPFSIAAADFSTAVTNSGLVFRGNNTDLPAALMAALAAKPFALLSGLSGSGKTQIARALGQWLGSDGTGQRYLVVPVRPDWSSPEALVGYEDALLPPSADGRRAWVVPEPMRFMLRAADDPDHLYLLVLDEMNLAHVERYFADVLSGIESGEPILPPLALEHDGYWRSSPGAGPRPLPNNLLVVGTVNIDETTYQFSPKVLDRAFTFDFRVSTEELDPAIKRPSGLSPTSDDHVAAVASVLRDEDWHVMNPAEGSAEITAEMIGLHERLSLIGFEFGHRTFIESMRFAATLGGVGVTDPDAALDWILMSKVLPKLHGSRRQLEGFLVDLLGTAHGAEPEKPVWPRTAQKVSRMLDLLRANQFVSFAE